MSLGPSDFPPGAMPPYRINPGDYPMPGQGGDPFYLGPPVTPPGVGDITTASGYPAAIAAVNGLEGLGGGGAPATAGQGWQIGGGGTPDKITNVGTAAPLRADPGMNPEFWDRLMALREAAVNAGGDIGVFSGSRNATRQQQLYSEAVKRYGSEAAAKKYVQPPGQSYHDPDTGLALGLGPGAIAADLQGHLAIAHRLAPSFGLTFSKTHPWHIQLAGV